MQIYILEQQAKAAVVEPKRNSISPKGIKEQSLTINSTDDDEIKGIFSNPWLLYLIKYFALDFFWKRVKMVLEIRTEI